MAINDPNYRYATQTWEADGVRTQYDIAFDGGYIRQSDVVAFSVLVDAGTGLVTDRQVHTLVFISENLEDGSATVRISPAVAAGRRVVIFRSTEKSTPLVDYQDGSILTEANLDLANKQAIFAIAEIMDGLNAASIDITHQVQEVIDLNALITSIYQTVLELLATGGIVSVAPRVWSFTGNGEDTDFPLVGADVADSGFYDTYVGRLGFEPATDYGIILGDTPADTVIRFTTPPADGIRCFTVLRGFAKPYTGPPPLTSLRIPIIDVDTTIHFIDKASEFALLRCTGTAETLLTVKEIPVAGDPLTKMGDGSYLSIMQKGDGQCTVDHDPTVTIDVPAGCLPKTRAVGSVISLTCQFGDGNLWVLSGDLAKE